MSPVKFCGSGTVLFSNNTTHYSPISTYAWTFGDGGIYNGTDTSHLYAAPGTYSVHLTATTINGCVDSSILTDTVKVYPVPTATINGIAVNCLTANSRLQYTSTVTSVDPIGHYQWLIDADSVGNAANLDIYYHVPGNHLLSLVVTTVNGCSYTATKNIIIDSVAAKIGVGNADFCNAGTVQFSNLSSHTSYSVNYSWIWGDNTAYNGVDTSHFYGQPGSYSVFLLAVTQNGCRDSLVLIDTVKIHSLPNVLIVGDSLHCTAGDYSYSSTLVSADPIVSYQWIVDNRLVGVAPVLNYHFNAGTHFISLIVISNHGCSDTAHKIIYTDSVDAQFNISQLKFCGDSGRVQLVNQSFASSGALNVIWNLGDGDTSHSLNPLHTYIQPGQYSIGLIVTSARGCTDTLVKSNVIKIDPNPLPIINGDTIRCSTGFGNYFSHSISRDTIVQYLWTVNGNNLSNTDSLNYYFSHTGTYQIHLQVTTNKACFADSTILVKVDSVHTDFHILPSRLCGDSGTVQFQNLSGSVFGNNQYQWSFGDAQTSLAINPVHFYQHAGLYSVGLTTIAATGCSGSIFLPDTIIVYPSPVIAIQGVSDKCMDNVLVYHSNVTSQDSVSGYQWTLNHLPLSTSDSLQYNFVLSGSYQIGLEVHTLHGCDVNASKLITIHPLPVPNATANTTICRGGTVLLQAHDGISYQWSPANAVLQPNNATTLTSPTINTTYQVFVTNAFGCMQKDTVQINVDVPVGLQLLSNYSICQGNSVQLSTLANSNHYQWLPPLYLNDPSSSSPIATPPVTTGYAVIAYSNNVCKNDTGFVRIVVGNIPTVNLGAAITTVAGTSIQLNATVSNDVVQYTWSPTNGLDCINCPNPHLIADQNITYQLTVQTALGCEARDDVSIYVICAGGQLRIPNAFTPNNDRLNDQFYIKGYGLSEVKHFTIFNRWGHKVFEKEHIAPNNPADGWDGTVNGEPVNVTTAFVYVVTVVCNDGQEFTYNGTVMLVK